MSLDEEQAFLAKNLINLETGALLTPMQVHAALIRVLGREVSVDYIYKLLYRHPLRKLFDLYVWPFRPVLLPSICGP